MAHHPQRARVHQVLGQLCVQPAVLLRHLSLPIARARGHGLGVGRPLTVHNVIYIFILSIYKTKFCPVSSINPVFFQRKFSICCPLPPPSLPNPPPGVLLCRKVETGGDQFLISFNANGHRIFWSLSFLMF